MKLHIILTSYNRPFFLRRTLDSLIAQTSPDWLCYLLDDGSEAETLGVIGEFTDSRISVILNHDHPIDRNAARYSILINKVLPRLNNGIVGYLCDNVEYAPSLVADVLGFFRDQPDAFSGYTTHRRDAWTPDGTRLGKADYFNHWNVTPPDIRPLSGSVMGLLDHSQVFHRLPVDLTWPEAAEFKGFGDGLFFTALARSYGTIYPIRPKHTLTMEHLFK